LLKTLAAVNGPSLRGLEGNGRFFPALRAHRLRFDPLNAYRAWIAALRADSLARFAPLGLVFEALVGEKHLLAGGENEFSPAFPALQDLIVVFHTLLRDRALPEQKALRARAGKTSERRVHSRFSYACRHETARMES
jgi:hypothetical protein